MPWSPKDAPRHTEKAGSSKEKSAWSRVANKVLKNTGNEGRAIRIANSTIKKMKVKDN